MSERLRDVERRIGTVRQLSTVVTAMRGIAAARVREANAQLDGIRTYAETVGAAIGKALALLGPDEAPGAGNGRSAGLVIAITAEQGFAGAFSERVLAHLATHAASASKLRVMLVGDRGATLAEQRGLPCDWRLPMVVHAGQVAALAERIADRLYQLVAAGEVSHVRLIHATPDHERAPEPRERMVLPFDYARFSAAADERNPLVHLAPAALAAKLADEYVFAEICEALTLSLAAENEARVAAMTEARSNVQNTTDRLSARQRQLRQEQITEEIMELAAGRSG